MDAWPTFWSHNEPLFRQHIADGYRFKQHKGLAHFVDADGKYATYPTGYITGPQRHTNGNPAPFQVNVHLGADVGWAQRNFKRVDHAVAWAFERAKEVLAESEVA